MKTIKTSVTAIICVITIISGYNLCFLSVAEGQDVLDGVYVPEHTPTRKVIPYAPLREADVMWSKRIWRVIDLREKINHPFYFPVTPIQNRKALIDVMKEGIMEGTITAYADAAIDDEFKAPMTKEEVTEIFIRIDTVFVEDPDDPDNYLEQVQETELAADEIRQIWVKEDWFFDRQRSVMDVRIIGLSPLKIQTDESGNFKGFEPLFWIYFPEARYVFANYEIFNRENDAERRTFEDLFWKRTFNSYIRKESNVYDRTIAEYTKGIDQQLEAERIKNNMFNFEHDLWSF